MLPDSRSSTPSVDDAASASASASASADEPSLIRHSRSRLHRTVAAGRPDAVLELLDRRAADVVHAHDVQDVNSFDHAGYTPLMMAVLGQNKPIVQLLVRRGAKTNLRRQRGRHETALHLAAKQGAVEIALELLSAGADATATTTDGYTPFHIAASSGLLAFCKWMYSRDVVDVDATTGSGSTALHLAAANGFEAVVAWLVQSTNANLSALNGFQRTPGQEASLAGEWRVAELLDGFARRALEARKKEKSLNSKLLSAAEAGDKAAVLGLIGRGANVLACNRSGSTALHKTAERGFADVVEQLLLHPVCPPLDQQTSLGLAPLHLAAKNGHADVVRLLIRAGASPSVTNAAGETPIEMAAKRGHLKLLALFDPTTSQADGKPVAGRRRVGDGGTGAGDGSGGGSSAATLASAGSQSPFEGLATRSGVAAGAGTGAGAGAGAGAGKPAVPAGEVEVRELLASLHMPHYADALVGLGFDSLPAMALIDDEDLTECGMVRSGGGRSSFCFRRGVHCCIFHWLH